MNGDPETEAQGDRTDLNRALAWLAWSGGWMMGIGFGVLVMFIATELPNDFYSRAKSILVALGIVTFVWGLMRSRSSGVLGRTPDSSKG